MARIPTRHRANHQFQEGLDFDEILHLVPVVYRLPIREHDRGERFGS
jgi:hypothetical protein